jgi:hypothetical protein
VSKVGPDLSCSSRARAELGVSHRPILGRYYTRVGIALSRRSMYFEAVPYLLTTLETAPSSAWASVTLAAVLACHGQLLNAFRFWKLACRLDPFLREPQQSASTGNAERARSFAEALEGFEDRCGPRIPVSVQAAQPCSRSGAVSFWYSVIMHHSLVAM